MTDTDTTTKTTWQTVADELADAFTTDKRNDGSKLITLKDDAPDWIDAAAVTMNAHRAIDDRMPDDWVYEQIAAIAYTLAEYDTGPYAVDCAHEIADGHVDIYYNALTAWLALHTGNLCLCDEAAEEYGQPDDESTDRRIMRGQFLALERITASLIEDIKAEAENREDLG